MTETPLDRDTTWTETPLDRDHPVDRDPLWTENPLDRDHHPHPRGETIASENITFKQLRFRRQ